MQLTWSCCIWCININCSIRSHLACTCPASLCFCYSTLRVLILRFQPCRLQSFVVILMYFHVIIFDVTPNQPQTAKRRCCNSKSSSRRRSIIRIHRRAMLQSSLLTALDTRRSFTSLFGTICILLPKQRIPNSAFALSGLLTWSTMALVLC